MDEIQEFVSIILNKRVSSYRLTRRESIAMAEVMERFSKRRNLYQI